MRERLASHQPDSILRSEGLAGIDVSPVAIVGVVALIVFHLTVGVKTRGLGRVSRFRPDDRCALRNVRTRR